MKNYMLICSFFLILTEIVTAQVGIFTEQPTETLDVNGTLGVRGGDEITTNSEPWLLSASSTGVVKKIPANIFSPVVTSVPVSTLFNDTVKVTVPDGYTNFQLDITSENPCSRWIYSSFRYVGKETILLGAAARGMNVAADATLTTIGIPPNGESWGASFHIFWDRSKILGCQAYGNSNTKVNTTGNYLHDSSIRRTASNVVSFVWGSIDDPAAIQQHTAIETQTLKWNFIFTKL